MYSPASPATGAVVTGLTSPTYTLSSGVNPDPQSIAKAVTALGGTQSGVVVASPSVPFVSIFTMPKQFRPLVLNQATGIPTSIPRNVWRFRTVKGVAVIAGVNYQPMVIDTTISIPAAADVVDAPNVKAGWSLHVGVLWEQSNELMDSFLTGVP